MQQKYSFYSRAEDEKPPPPCFQSHDGIFGGLDKDDAGDIQSLL